MPGPPHGAPLLTWPHRRRTEDNREARQCRDSKRPLPSALLTPTLSSVGQPAGGDAPPQAGERKTDSGTTHSRTGPPPAQPSPGTEGTVIPPRKTRRGMQQNGLGGPSPPGSNSVGLGTAWAARGAAPHSTLQPWGGLTGQGHECLPTGRASPGLPPKLWGPPRHRWL